MDDLPVEIKEVIIYFCNGESLHKLRQLNRTWRSLVDQEDKRRQLFKKCLKTGEIDKSIVIDLIRKIYPKTSFLKSNPHLYRYIYNAVLRWKYFSDCRFEVQKFSQTFSGVVDLKISGSIVCVGDKRGFHTIDFMNKSLIAYDLGKVKNIELYCIHSKPINKNYKYDMADITTENNVHSFYNISTKSFDKSKSYYEKKCVKYWNERSIELNMNQYGADPLIKADYYEHFVMMVTPKNIIQFKDSCRMKLHKTPLDSSGSRAMFLWHSKLMICAKDESLSIFVNGKTTTINYMGFPPVSAIFYYAGWLFLGTRIGLLYGYNVRFDQIFSLELENFQMKLKICNKAIVKIDVMERKTLSLVIACDEEIFLVNSKTKERTVESK